MTTILPNPNNNNSRNVGSTIMYAYPQHDIIWRVRRDGVVTPALTFRGMPCLCGKLSVSVKMGRKLRKKQLVGQQDPFVEVTIGKDSKKTPVAKNGGTDPQWDHPPLVYDLDGEHTVMRVLVYNHSMLRDERIGKVKVPLPPLLQMANPTSLYESREFPSGSSGLSFGGPAPSSAPSSAPADFRPSIASILNGGPIIFSHEAWFELGLSAQQQTSAGFLCMKFEFEPNFDHPNETMRIQTEFNRRTMLSDIHSGKLAHQPSKMTLRKLKSKDGKKDVKDAKESKPDKKAEAETKKKLEKAMKEKARKKRKGAVLFGGNIQDGISASHSHLPLVVEETVEWLKENGGYKTEGIFRVPGVQEKIQAMKQSYEKAFEKGDQKVALSDCLDVGGLLKLYLRELSEPPIPFTHYPHFLDIVETKESRTDSVEKFKILIASMPQENRDLLYYLGEFLCNVAVNASATKMDLKNLAIVFAPNCLRPLVETADTIMKDANRTIMCLQLLLENFADIFKSAVEIPADDLEDAPNNAPAGVQPPRRNSESSLSFGSGAMHGGTGLPVSQQAQPAHAKTVGAHLHPRVSMTTSSFSSPTDGSDDDGDAEQPSPMPSPSGAPLVSPTSTNSMSPIGSGGRVSPSLPPREPVNPSASTSAAVAALAAIARPNPGSSSLKSPPPPPLGRPVSLERRNPPATSPTGGALAPSVAASPTNLVSPRQGTPINAHARTKSAMSSADLASSPPNPSATYDRPPAPIRRGGSPKSARSDGDGALPPSPASSMSDSSDPQQGRSPSPTQQGTANAGSGSPSKGAGSMQSRPLPPRRPFGSQLMNSGQVQPPPPLATSPTASGESSISASRPPQHRTPSASALPSLNTLNSPTSSTPSIPSPSGSTGINPVEKAPRLPLRSPASEGVQTPGSVPGARFQVKPPNGSGSLGSRNSVATVIAPVPSATSPSSSVNPSRPPPRVPSGSMSKQQS